MDARNEEHREVLSAARRGTLGRRAHCSVRSRSRKDPWGANFGSGQDGYELTFNLVRLGKVYFDRGVTEDLNDLLIHEFAHKFGDHLSKEFDRAMSRLGAKMVTLALNNPGFFRKFGE